MTQVAEENHPLGYVYYLAPVVLSAGLFYASLYFPPAWFLVPAPLFIGFAIHGYAIGVLQTIIAASLLYPVAGSQHVVVFVASCGLITLGLAYPFHRKVRLPIAAVVSASFSFAAIAAFFALYVTTQGYSAASMISALVNEHVGAVIEAYQRIESEEALVNWLERNREVVVTFITSISPSILFFMVLAAVLANLAVITIIADRAKIDVAFVGEDFSVWRAPNLLAWVFLVCGLGVILLPTGALQTIGINIVLFASAIYIVLGLSVASYFMKKWEVPSLFLTIGLFIIIAQPQLMFLAGFAGLIDQWADFRSINIAEEKTNEI